ncbi:hypothetical protein GXW82_44405 [Streptacidiphilus sp. 4-A2]|nr:hypothetical protein [Streptacidiphilus sp. 4-A2]
MLSPNNRPASWSRSSSTPSARCTPDLRSHEDGLFMDLSGQLGNPAADPAMRQLTGLDKKVADHVLGTSGAMPMVERIAVSAKAILDSYADKRHKVVRATIASRNGRHRSVAVAEASRSTCAATASASRSTTATSRRRGLTP